MLNVEYNPAIPFLSTGLVNEGHHSDAQSFRYTILVCCGRRRTYAHVHFRDADGIGWFLRRTLWPCPETEPQSGREPASNEVAGVSISWDAAAMSVTEKEASRLSKLDRIGGLGDPGAQQQE